MIFSLLGQISRCLSAFERFRGPALEERLALGRLAPTVIPKCTCRAVMPVTCTPSVCKLMIFIFFQVILFLNIALIIYCLISQCN